jgi:hypothetical protein
VGVQEVRWDRVCTKSTGKYIFSNRKWNGNEGTVFFVHKRIIQQLRSEKMSYIIPSHSMSNYQWSFGLDIGFIYHFNTLLVITLNYSSIADLHTLPNHAKSSPACRVFPSSCLVTASNNGYSSASRLSPL